MAYAIGLWLRDTSLKLRQHGIDLNKRALEQVQKTDTTIYTGNTTNSDDTWKWNNGENDENLTWLL